MPDWTKKQYIRCVPLLVNMMFWDVPELKAFEKALATFTFAGVLQSTVNGVKKALRGVLADLDQGPPARRTFPTVTVARNINIAQHLIGRYTRDSKLRRASGRSDAEYKQFVRDLSETIHEEFCKKLLQVSAPTTESSR